MAQLEEIRKKRWQNFENRINKNSGNVINIASIENMTSKARLITIFSDWFSR